MKIDFSQPLKNLEDKPLVDEEKKPILLSVPCINSLLATPQDSRIEPAEKMIRWILAQKITQAKGPVELNIEDVAKIKELVGLYMPTLIMGSVWKILENERK